jgi:DNA-binding transcriptional LysR family regulator
LAEDLPDFLVAFAREQPGIQLAVHEVRDTEVIDLVAARRLDLGLSALRGDSSQMPLGLRTEPVFDLDLLLLVPLRHRLARQKKVCLEAVPFTELLNDLDFFPSDLVSARLRESLGEISPGEHFGPLGAQAVYRENALNQGALQITVKALRDWVKGEGWQAISSEL